MIAGPIVLKMAMQVLITLCSHKFFLYFLINSLEFMLVDFSKKIKRKRKRIYVSRWREGSLSL